MPAWAAPSQQTIVFVRHGEKPEAGLGQLTCQGLNRALALPPVLAKLYGTPDYLFAPDPSHQVKEENGQHFDYVRPLATIEPTAIRLAKPVNTTYGYAQIDRLQKELLLPAYRNALAFVAWEHKEVVKLVRAVLAKHGGDPAVVPEWPQTDFDRIYVLRLTWDGGKAKAAFSQDQEGLNGQSTSCP